MNPRPRNARHTDIPAARELLRAGLSLKQAAQYLGVFSGSLDQELWHYIGVPDHQLTNRYRPMF